MRKIALVLTVITLGIYSATSCKQGPQDIPTINLEKYSGDIDLELSDLLSEIRIVQLESNEHSIISGYEFAISEDYIVATDENSIKLFDRNGKYIRNLAYRGRGPNEYTNLYSIYIDNNNILYCSDGRKVFRIDIDNDTFLDPISTTLTPLVVRGIGKNNLYMTRGNTIMRGDPLGNDSTFLFADYNLETGTETAVRSYSTLKALHSYDNLHPYKDELIYVNRNYSDSVFRLKNDHLEPILRVKIENSAASNESGYTSFISFVGKPGIILDYREQNVEINEIQGGYSSYTTSKVINYLLYNDKSGLQRINSIFINPLGVKFTTEEFLESVNNRKMPRIYPLFSVKTGDYAYYSYDAHRMMDLLEYALSENENNPEADNLRAILANLKEDDNPALIIGRVK